MSVAQSVIPILILLFSVVGTRVPLRYGPRLWFQIVCRFFLFISVLCRFRYFSSLSKDTHSYSHNDSREVHFPTLWRSPFPLQTGQIPRLPSSHILSGGLVPPLSPPEPERTVETGNFRLNRKSRLSS